MKSQLMLAGVVALLSSCGIYVNGKENDDAQTKATDESPNKGVDQAVEPQVFVMRGFVRNAFDVIVDGKVYADLETFYTEESQQLGQRLQAAGYDANWSATFDAQVGFEDLWQAMTVYISPAGDRGYQGKSIVDSAGGFAHTFPQEARADQYRVRANKRLGVVLKHSNGDQRRLCYNFSAVDHDVSFVNREAPVILSVFQTIITTYDCEQPQASGGGPTSGVVVPENPPLPSL